MECLALFAVALRQLYSSALNLTSQEAERHLQAALTKPDRQGRTPIQLARQAQDPERRSAAYLEHLVADTDASKSAVASAQFAAMEERIQELLVDTSANEE